MNTSPRDMDRHPRLAGTNKFELLLFRLGASTGTGREELYGINVFKVREVLAMPPVTQLANSHQHLMGVANIRGHVIPVINLPAVTGCLPVNGLKILMVTEFGRTVQAFAVEDVNEIVTLEWDQVIPVDGNHAGAMITGIGRVEGINVETRLAQILDVEQILRMVIPPSTEDIARDVMGPEFTLPEGTTILVADDSVVARSIIELSLNAMGLPFVMTQTGKEAWDLLQSLHEGAQSVGKNAGNKIALVLTDLEMPEMDGLTLTRLIKQDPRFKQIPVVIHSSLTGSTNEEYMKSVGANACVTKFSPRDFAATIRKVLSS